MKPYIAIIKYKIRAIVYKYFIVKWYRLNNIIFYRKDNIGIRCELRVNWLKDCANCANIKYKGKGLIEYKPLGLYFCNSDCLQAYSIDNDCDYCGKLISTRSEDIYFNTDTLGDEIQFCNRECYHKLMSKHREMVKLANDMNSNGGSCGELFSEPNF